jgi:hypothetical protein
MEVRENWRQVKLRGSKQARTQERSGLNILEAVDKGLQRTRGLELNMDLSWNESSKSSNRLSPTGLSFQDVRWQTEQTAGSFRPR